MEPAGTSTTSPHATCRQAIRLAIDPSAIASRSCSEVSRRSRPRAMRAPGSAERTYQASDLPRASPIERAKASPGCTWTDSGSCVKSSFRSSEGSWAAESVRSYQISPILPFARPASLHGRRSAAAPGLFDRSRRGKFYRHGRLLVRAARRGSTRRSPLAKSRRMAARTSVQRDQRGGLRTGCC